MRDYLFYRWRTNSCRGEASSCPSKEG